MTGNKAVSNEERQLGVEKDGDEVKLGSSRIAARAGRHAKKGLILEHQMPSYIFRSMSSSYVCRSCRQKLAQSLLPSTTPPRRPYHRPAFAPKPNLDLRHIRKAPGLYEQNCIDRNYGPSARNGWKILELHDRLVQLQSEAVHLRQRNNVIAKELKAAGGQSPLLAEAREIKAKLAELKKIEKDVPEEMERLALELPNLSSLDTPVGNTPAVIEYINGDNPPQTSHTTSHVDVGRELDILDFEGSAVTSGWGWYFLKNEGAMLEQALVQFALSVALQHGWQVTTPPSLVYSHIASACGFMPRDNNGETQIYNIAQDTDVDNKPHLVLAGTAEIPFAGSQANKVLPETSLPLKIIGPSRCYRAEAGARGVDTKGLYRVHEFTKVEMFAWTTPPYPSPSDNDRTIFDDDETLDDDSSLSQADQVFAEMTTIQKSILTQLGLHARVLEMPTADLGASASRKIDMEVFFPSRRAIDDGYGEVTSASQCGAYQTRRLGTQYRRAHGDGKLDWPHTLNGTAMAVPRVLAAILENEWDERTRSVAVPECLRRWMPGEIAVIGPKGLGVPKAPMVPKASKED